MSTERAHGERDARPAAGFRGPILVSGGTGFLGGEVVRMLHARGNEVHVLVRPTSERGALADLALRWHVGELSDGASIDRALAALHESARRAQLPAAVIHSAALISYKTRDRERQRAINVEGTRTLLEASLRHGCARFVFVSSVVAVGHCVGSEVLDEQSPFNSARLGVDYVTTKRAAEELVLAAAPRLDVVVVNPGAIFGAVDRHSNTVRFIRQVARGKGPRLAPPGSISVLGVQDAARGVVLALDRGRRAERYLLVESNLTALELFARIARALGMPPVTRRVPRVLWPAVTFAARLWDRIFPLDLAPPQALRMLGVELRFDARKARSELGWRPLPFDQVLDAAVASLHERQLL